MNNRTCQYNTYKTAAKRAVDIARREIEEELYRWPNDDSGQKMICKLAHESDEDSKDVNAGTMIKTSTDRKEMLQVWEDNFNTLLNKREERETERERER